jgi:hypothetical protein
MKFVKPEKRIPTSCSCAACRNMCHISPCFPTPEQVEKLVQAGHRDGLMPSLWGNLETGDVFALVAPRQTKAGCIFLQGGKCSLHMSGLKPLEGKLSLHDQPDNGLRQWVCEKWLTPKGLEVFKMFSSDPIDQHLIESRIQKTVQ